LIPYQIHNIALIKNYIVHFEHLEVVERKHVLSNGTCESSINIKQLDTNKK